jgi:hypothetical protein
MCNFFSFLSDAKGNFYYADWELRQSIQRGEIKDGEPDSHSWLAKHFIKNAAEDKLNKYEYNPLTKVFTVDQINTDDDRVSAEKWVREVKWSRIVKPLIIKKIKHPLLGNAKTLTLSDKKLVKEWASVRDSVGDSVRDSVGASVRDSVGDSVRDSVGASVRDSVGDSVWASVGASVWASVWAYYGSFFDIEYKVNVSQSNKLWDRGFVVSFYGTTYRVHSGKQAKIVWEYKP